MSGLGSPLNSKQLKVELFGLECPQKGISLGFDLDFIGVSFDSHWSFIGKGICN